MEQQYEFDRVTEHCYLGDITIGSVYSGYLHRVRFFFFSLGISFCQSKKKKEKGKEKTMI